MKKLYIIYLINAVFFSLAVFDVFSIPIWLYIATAFWLGGAGLIIIKGE